MAGVAQKVQVVSSDKSEVFEPDLTFNINTSESTSLQELIDSELALRISNSDSQEPDTELTETVDTPPNSYIETIPVRTVHPIKFELEPDINEQFIFSEKEHTSFQLLKNNTNLDTPEPLRNEFEVLSTDDQNLYENLVDIKSNTDTENLVDVKSNSDIENRVDVKPNSDTENIVDVKPNSDTELIVTEADSSDILDTKQVEIPLSDLDLNAESRSEVIVDTQLIDVTNINDSESQSVEVIDTIPVIETSDTEPPENAKCDLSEQNNQISTSTNLVEIEIESVHSDTDVNNSMSETNCPGVDLINDVNPQIVFSDEPNSFSSPVDSESPVSPNCSEDISATSPVQAAVYSPASPCEVVDFSPSSPPDVIIQVNGAAPVFEEDGFDTWMTVEDAIKSPNDLSPDENIAQQTEIFDVFETIDDGHYEDVIERSRLESENSLDIESIKHTENIIEEQKVDQCDGDATCNPAVHDQSPSVFPPDQSESDGDLTESSTTMTKTVKKKKSLDGGEAVVTRTKKTKKTKKSEEKENHISVKSSFSKFDQLSKKGAVLHVRSSDSAKAQKQFQGSAEGVAANPSCKACGKTVFAMEQIKAERSVWHKNCFRCKECNKQLTVDIYQSHEGELYCKPHFKELFKPKAVIENTEDEPASDKADLGLEELSSLNVKSRFQVFEKPTSEEVERSPSTVNVKRSPSILSKLAKFQKKGMDVGVTDESLNGVEYEESSSSSEEENEEGIIKSSKLPERPVSFNKMDDVKRSWESGQTARRAEMREEHKKEIQNIRSRLFMGKQGKMKEMYEQAVAESEGRAGSGSAKKEVEQLRCEKARLMKERFEKGEPITDSEDEDGEKKKTKENDDMSVFEAGISKKSRSLFMELDATAAKTQQATPSIPTHTPTPRTRTSSQNVSRQVSDDVVRSSDVVEDVIVETADVSSKFKFFETYKAPEKERKAFRITPPREGQVKEESPDREIYRDPEIVRSEDQVDDDELVKRSNTTAKMLSLFRQMEEAKEPVIEGPKPLKCFTPPPDYKEEQSGSSGEEDEDESEEEEESEEDTGIVRASDKIEDESLKQAQNAARAKALKEKFEHWEPEKQSVNNAINLLDTEQDSIESTKSLRARFESLKSEQPKEKSRPKVNRFVEAPATSICAACDKKVYHLEKVEASGKLFHKDCFRCTQCNCKLRMESYTLNNGQVYCLPHFRQLFIAKGNYDEGFGSDQHKRKWESSQTVNGTH